MPQISPAITTKEAASTTYPIEGTYIQHEIVADLAAFAQYGSVAAYWRPDTVLVSNAMQGPHGELFWSSSVNAEPYLLPIQPQGENNRQLADRLCQEHPAISTYEGVFGGIPHIKGVRFSVADVLSHLYDLGSIDEIEKAFAPDISKDQIKEAIAYAQDFLESALSP